MASASLDPPLPGRGAERAGLCTRRAPSFTPDGLVSEYAAYYDQYTLLQQLGHVPAG
jgi:hypothetical protein